MESIKLHLKVTFTHVSKSIEEKRRERERENISL